MRTLREPTRHVLLTTDAVGGVWTYALELIQGLREIGITAEIAVLGPSRPDAADQARACGATKVHRVPGKLEWMNDPWKDVHRAGLRLLRIAADSGADVVHLNEYCHADLPWPQPALVVGHSCVCSWFEAVRGSEAPPEFDIYRERVRRGLHSAALVTAPSLAMLACLRRFYGPFRSRGPVYNAACASMACARCKEPMILTAGRLWDEAKGTSVLDRAAPRVPWPIMAAGSCDAPEEDTVSFSNLLLLGALRRERLMSLMARASIFALPAKYEPFGLSVLEAAQAGCALVLGDIPTLRELWDGCAIFARPDDADSLADALNLLIREPAILRRYAEAAQQRSRRYSRRCQAENYARLYEVLRQDRASAAGLEFPARHELQTSRHFP